jgi:hypothetical protein
MRQRRKVGRGRAFSRGALERKGRFMAMLDRCTRCRGFAPARADRCPHCGAAVPRSGARGGVARTLGAGGALASVALGGAFAFSLMACYGAPPCPDGTRECYRPPTPPAVDDAGGVESEESTPRAVSGDDDAP